MLLFLVAAHVAAADDLESELGRSESRIRSAPYVPPVGRTVFETALPERLERLGYRRVRQRPDEPGEYFWGNEIFWFYRHAHRHGGEDHPAELLGLRLRDNVITGHVNAADGDAADADAAERVWLEPELLAESLGEDRAPRVPVDLESLPEHVWRAVLAAEDARFFDHAGVDSRSVARALLANVRSGQVEQGGSTITQQLIKNRDLTPKRSLGRKASEAVRALALETEYTKEEILQAYLNHVYLGHVDGVAVHGVGTAARVWFSKRAGDLDLAEAASLAAMIQGPNRLSPHRHAERLEARRNWVLSRLEELEWTAASEVAAAKRQPVRARLREPSPPQAPHLRRWVAAIAREKAPGRVKQGRGLVVETTLDPWLQALAEDAVREELERLRRAHRSLRRTSLAAALVAVDADTGDVVAYVGGDPASGSELDHVRQARRQPGSTVKPLALLEAFEDCGGHKPLHPATRVSDAALRLDLPSGPWEPANSDGRFRGVVDLREAVRSSLNVPMVRVARWCGFEPTARTLRRAGLDLPDEAPPSFVLGAVETAPLELVAAYTVLATPGRVLEPRPIRRLERPGGRRKARFGVRSRKVVRPATAYLVRELLVDAATRGTAGPAAIEGLDVAAKTGTSSERRDAWLAGHAGSLVTVVWVGRGDGAPLGLTGTAAAAPLWKRFMERAVVARPERRLAPPEGVVTLHVDSETGLLVRESNRRSRPEVFRRGVVPRRDRFWRADDPTDVIR